MASELPSVVGRSGARPDINITPLVDVVLVLLIIFMVVMPQMEAGLTVALPALATPDPAEEAQMEPTTVTLTRDGRLYLEKEETDEAALEAALVGLHRDRPQARVVLKADTEVDYGKVRGVFRICREVGFPGAALQVLDLKNKKG